MFLKHCMFEVSACRKRYCAFIGLLVIFRFCPICDKPNEPLNNEPLNNEITYYFPFEDRLRNLLQSDLKRFLNYSKLRVPPTAEDIYDGVN